MVSSMDFEEIPAGTGYLYTDIPTYDLECLVKMKFQENLFSIMFYSCLSIYMLNWCRRKFN